MLPTRFESTINKEFIQASLSCGLDWSILAYKQWTLEIYDSSCRVINIPSPTFKGSCNSTIGFEWLKLPDICFNYGSSICNLPRFITPNQLITPKFIINMKVDKKLIVSWEICNTLYYSMFEELIFSFPSPMFVNI